MQVARQGLEVPLSDGRISIAAENELFVSCDFKAKTLGLSSHELSRKFDVVLLDFKKLDSAVLAGKIEILADNPRAPDRCVDTVLRLGFLCKQVPLNDYSVKTSSDESSALATDHKRVTFRA